MSWLTRLRSAFSAGSEAATVIYRSVREPSGQIVPQLPLYLQLQRIGGSVTPVQVSQIIREADGGKIRRLVDLSNESRQKDGHLQGILKTLEDSVEGLPWQILPYKDDGAKNPKKRDAKVATFVETSLKEAHEFSRLLAHLAGGQYHGHATSETILTQRRGYVVPDRFVAISQRRFEFDLKTGDLVWRDDGMSAGVNLLADHPPGKFVQYQPRVNGDVPCREGLARVLIWAALFRNWTLRDWLTLAELAWKPWRTGKFQKNASKEDIEHLERALDEMSASGTATFPETTDAKIEWPKNGITGNSAHKELFDTLGSEMSKATLGQTLTTEQGTRGSQSLGKVHEGVRKDRLEAIARGIAAVIMRDLIIPLVRMNFGEGVQIPAFVFITDDALDLESYSAAIKNLHDAGLRIPARPVRDMVGLPEPEAGEECLGEGDEDDDGDDKKDPKDAEDDAKKPEDDAEPEKEAA